MYRLCFSVLVSTMLGSFIYNNPSFGLDPSESPFIPPEEINVDTDQGK